ncbi:lipocalin-like domain-containing protein [Aquimarina sediminis]|uniref:lipocalin family protein n=1 Tax=Aquimarina sediminis TaxID=2070536 RepID=UPI001F4DE976|nr:lipocalin family protein [Aquimarina sediminis]
MKIKLNMHKTLFFLILISIISCTKTDPKNYIEYLDGYWEIKRVVMLDGSEKEYKFNMIIDFLEINDSTGIRKKVKPKFDGNYTITNNSEAFTLKIENDSLRLYYKTPLTAWKETIISAKENQLVIKNETGNVYFYQRYQKIKL